MANPAEARGALASWLAVPDTIEVAIAGLEDADLDARGAVYDWSWVYPSDAWNERMGYAKAPVQPAIQVLRALGQHLGGLIQGQPDAMQRSVQLLDAPGAKLYTRSVAELLEQEVEHARGHLRVLAEIRGGGGHGC